MTRKPCVLIILDGWGVAPDGPGNAVTHAQTSNFNNYWSSYPHALLEASGEAVGLPKNEKGNSETGHLNLGAGRIIYQELPKIDMSIADGSFFKNFAINLIPRHITKNNSSVHLMGLVSAGTVHSSSEHLFALLRYCKEEKIKNVFLHLFTDGRDSPPASAGNFISKINSKLREMGVGKIASLCGRYYAMDRDHHWDRTERAYDLIVLGKGNQFDSTDQCLEFSYKQGLNDEFLQPSVIKENGSPVATVKDGDVVVFFNFRIDRPRQLTKAFVLPHFESFKEKKSAFDPYAEKYGLKQYQPIASVSTFKRRKILKNLLFITMTSYEDGLPVEVIFPREPIENPLGQVLSLNNLKQFHISETEKERFVTYYFNGQKEKSFAGEERKEIASPKVATYDKKPEMAAFEITNELLRKISGDAYDFIVVNYANPDMVGHTGVFAAGVKACEAVDKNLGSLVDFILEKDGTAVITADHGNIEEMINLKTGEIDTEHSSNPVPFIIVKKEFEGKSQISPRGILADAAPTILKLMGISKPADMTGRSLVD